VVLLHGLLGSGRNLATLARGVGAPDTARSVVAVDLTGHGGSPPLPADADLTTLAADLLATVDALGLAGPLALVGHSLGGRVALGVARRAAARVRSVTLLDVAPGPLPEGGEVSRVLDALLAAPAAFASRAAGRAGLAMAGLPSALADWLALNLEPAGEGYAWRVDRRALARLHARIRAEDLWPVVESPRGWTLRCVRGGASPYVTAADVRRLEASGGVVVTIEGAGHFLHVEQPAAVLEAVLGGLD
jgi:pimeloyl-ACP methyl ester carboxylesterase